MFWRTTRYRIDLSRPQVMGIVNVTPDSFSDGGRFNDPAQALGQCERLLKEGADILDIGGESSRPGATILSVDEEWARVAPVLAAAVTLGVPVSIDTCKAEVMQRALDLGADIVNDIHALTGEGAEAVVARHGACGVCLMHMRGDPGTMQSQTSYDDVVAEVAAYLAERAQHLVQTQGVGSERLVLDPGIGFGKTPQQNLTLLRRQAELLDLGFPLLVGWSRKSTLGVVTGRPVTERLPASLAAALAGVALGARIVRVHDVAATVDALKVWQAAGLGTG
ncbi:MAG: dihydropteroate synthase [Rubrivivax sp.]|nr:MAG: dihydropteroate synthase [Rubrivivax sp.]